MAGSDSGPADSISRGNMSMLFSHVSNASKQPTLIQDDLWTQLVSEQPNWLSLKWKTLFTSFCKEACITVEAWLYGRTVLQTRIDYEENYFFYSMWQTILWTIHNTETQPVQ